MSPRRERAPIDALVLMVGKALVGAWVLHQGFTHVSDDDYSRTVIAEQFAHAPRLDPSGTSWLPLPFWVVGSIMLVGGRSLGVARAVALLLGVVSVVLPYLTMREIGMRRGAALVATAVAMVLPWNAWLGVATVPEGWCGAVLAAAIMLLGKEEARASGASRPWAAAALLVASLSRYEAWPACVMMAGLCAWTAARQPARRWREVACALVAVAGPAAWLAENAFAHGSAFHFLARVTTFRHAIGAADIPLGDKLLGYPRALLEETPEVAALGLLGLAGLGWSPTLRTRWSWPAVVLLVTLALLVWGDVGDGAPTHHAARALAAAWWVLVAMGVDSAATFAGTMAHRRRTVMSAAAAVAGLAWCAWLPSRWAVAPGESEDERREGPIAEGLGLRAQAVAHVEIIPCQFEHFALLAAWGAPERATLKPRSGDPVTAQCPRVVVR